MWALVSLLLISMVWPVEVSGFLTRPVVTSNGWATTAAAKVSTMAAARNSEGAVVGGRRTATTIPLETMPAVVVSFGLTPQERRAAEESVFQEGTIFPAGLHFLDGSGLSGGGDTTIRQALADATLGQQTTPETSTTTTTTASTSPANHPTSSSTASAEYLPKLFLVIPSPTHVSPSEAEGGSEWLRLTIVEELDGYQAVPPAIVSCVPASSSDLPSGAALWDTPLSDVWRQEARLHFEENGLCEPLKVHDTEWCPSDQDVKVAMSLEMDGAWVASPGAPGGARWDTSKLVVLDGLVDDELCRHLLDLVTEPGWATTTTTPKAIAVAAASSAAADTPLSQRNGDSMKEETEIVAREGPPTSKWDRGLTDVDQEEEEEEEEEEEGNGRGAEAGSWGLTENAMEWLCREGEHPAIVELHSRLCKLYPDFVISHMPEACMGPSTARMVANAPVYGDRFSWHVDADPAAFPPSPWRDHFGTYTNREPGMPLFATLLVYLDADWQRDWDAETLFLDAPTDTGVFVRPRGGRAVIMDQDVTHRISTPSQTAGRPRYSLALKLIFFSRWHGHYSHPHVATAATAQLASATQPPPSSSRPPSELCITSLSALRGSGHVGAAGSSPARFGSARAEEPARPPRAPSPPPPPPPSSHLGDSASHHERGDGGGGGGDAREGVDACGGSATGGVPSSPSSLSSAYPSSSSASSSSSSSAAAAAAAADPMVEVKPVGAKGMGLFAARPIAKGVAVAFYSGELLTGEQLDDRYPDFEGSEYVMQLGPDLYLDARDPEMSSIARYANHSSRPNLAVELHPIPDGGAAAAPAAAAAGVPCEQEGVALTTLRDVARGEELTFDYGDDYFDGDDDVGDVIEDGQDMQDLLDGVDWGSNTFSSI